MQSLFNKRVLEAQKNLGLTNGSTQSLNRSIKQKSESFKLKTVH